MVKEEDDNEGEKEDEKEDIYEEEGRESELEDDKISPEEEGFIEGAHDDGQGAKCRTCGRLLLRNIVEKEIKGEIYRFCSNKCAESYKKTNKDW